LYIQAAGNRCAFDLSSVDIPLQRRDIVRKLSELGFKTLDIDVVQAAEQAVGISTYKRGARMSQAPTEMDCSGFIKWVYAQRGIRVPRRAAHQKIMAISVHMDAIRPGDLVFTAGPVCPPIGHEQARVGHVGIVCRDETVLHATTEIPGGIVRSSLMDWKRRTSWRGAGRVLQHPEDTITLEVPPSLEIESSDDITWALLETMDWKKQF
jgi:hypothetical protein